MDIKATQENLAEEICVTGNSFIGQKILLWHFEWGKNKELLHEFHKETSWVRADATRYHNTW